MNKPITIDIVDEALAAVGVRGISRTDEGRIATFGPWVDTPAFRLVVLVPGESSLLLVRAQPGVAFPLEDLPELLAACNTWHQQHRWPRLTVIERADALMVEADLQIPCPAGISSDQVAGVIATFVAATHDFWQQMSAGTAPIDGVLAGLAELLGGPDV